MSESRAVKYIVGYDGDKAGHLDGAVVETPDVAKQAALWKKLRRSVHIFFEYSDPMHILNAPDTPIVMFVYWAKHTNKVAYAHPMWVTKYAKDSVSKETQETPFGDLVRVEPDEWLYV